MCRTYFVTSAFFLLQDPNAVLFIFRTYCAEKILLQISTVLSTVPELLPENRLLIRRHLQDVLSGVIDLPDNGELHEITTIEGLRVLVWNFEKYTRDLNSTLTSYH